MPQTGSTNGVSWEWDVVIVNSSSRELPEQVGKLVVNGLGSVGVSRTNRVGNTVMKVTPKQNLCGSPQRLGNRRYLRQNIRAVTVLFDHSLKAPDLSLDPSKPSDELAFLDFFETALMTA